MGEDGSRPTGRREEEQAKRVPILVFERPLSRRDLLRGAAAAGVGLSAASVLAACGGDDEVAVVTGGGDAAAGPKQGGRLRVGHVGSGKAENFNPALGSSFIDASRYVNVYDLLVRVEPDLDAGSRPGSRVGAERRLHRLAVHASPGRRLARRVAVHGGGRHLHDPKLGKQEARGARRLDEHPARRAQGERRLHARGSAQGPERAAAGFLHPAEQRRHQGRDDRLHAADWHGPVHGRVLHGR